MWSGTPTVRPQGGGGWSGTPTVRPQTGGGGVERNPYRQATERGVWSGTLPLGHRDGGWGWNGRAVA